MLGGICCKGQKAASGFGGLMEGIPGSVALAAHTSPTSDMSHHVPDGTGGQCKHLQCSTLSASPNQDSSELPVLPGIPSHGTPTPCIGAMCPRHKQ